MNDKKVRSKHGSKICGGVLMVAAVLSVYLIDWRHEPEEEPTPIRPLKTIVVGELHAGTEWQYPGRASAGEQATVAFEVSGMVKELLVKEGDMVESGRLLATLDDRDYQNALRSSQAELDRAKSQLDRMQLAAESNAVSEQEVTNAQAAFDKAQAELDIRAKAVEDTKLKARFAGTVATTFVQAFENVQAKQKILSLQNLQRIEIKASIPEARLALVDPSARARGHKREQTSEFYATFDYFPDRAFQLEVKEFSTEADEATQTFLATFIMDAPTDVTILPGMTAMVSEKMLSKKEFAEDAALLLPLDAVPVDGLGQYFVWILEQDAGDVYAVTRRDVTVDEMTGASIKIKSGISKGDRIAAAGVNILLEGQKVRLLSSEG